MHEQGLRTGDRMACCPRYLQFVSSRRAKINNFFPWGKQNQQPWIPPDVCLACCMDFQGFLVKWHKMKLGIENAEFILERTND